MSEAGRGRRTGIRAGYLGRMDFLEAWNLQQRFWAERAEGRLKEDVFLFLEHEPVLTLGQGATEANVIARRSPADGSEVPLVRVNRGGEVTYHGPGQLMLYAICDLRERERDVHLHCRRLEEVFVRYLEALGHVALRRPGNPGLWVGGGKILSLGVGARRWVTLHGVAFNVSTDLRFFEMIHPCGEVDGSVTSLERLGEPAVPLRSLVDVLLPVCAEVFGLDVAMEWDAGRLMGMAAGVA